MMCNYEEAMDNLTTVREFTKRYRHEITVGEAIVARAFKMMEFDDYVKVMNELTLDEFCGNLLVGLFDTRSTSMIRDVLDGKMSFIELYAHVMDKNQVKELKERLNVE